MVKASLSKFIARFINNSNKTSSQKLTPKNSHAQVSVIVLAGGRGSRFGGELPKQFLLLEGKPVITHALDLFLSIPEISEVIVVCDAMHREALAHYSVSFADPGIRRQDSLFSGFAKIHHNTDWVMVHDAARPLVTRELILKLLETRSSHLAATLAMPVSATIKEAYANIVKKTLDRSVLWEIQTPQLLHRKALEKGFKIAHAKNITLTDDVSLAELAGIDVMLVPSSSTNIKITLKDDLKLAEALITISNSSLF